MLISIESSSGYVDFSRYSLDYLSQIGRYSPYYVSHYIKTHLSLLKERFPRTFDQRFSILILVYEGWVPLLRGIRDFLQLSGVGAISLVLPPSEKEWANLEFILKNLIGLEKTTNPFVKLEKDPKKAIHLEDLFFLFDSFKEGAFVKAFEGTSTIFAQRQALKETSTHAFTVFDMKVNIAHSSSGMGKEKFAKRLRKSVHFFIRS